MASVAAYDYENKKIQSLLAHGFLRNVLNTEQNYNDVFSIIILYHRQGFAKYYDAKIDTDYKGKMRFGDIVKINNKYITLDVDEKFIEIGAMEETEEEVMWLRSDKFDGDIRLRIPFLICKHLTNAISYYSKFNENTTAVANNMNYLYSAHFNVKHDDCWIIDKFGGPLNHTIKKIVVKFNQSKLPIVWINFGNKIAKYFHVQKFSITYKHIDGIYEMRQDKKDLVKIKVQAKSRSQFCFTNKMSLDDADSILWFSKRSWPDFSYYYTGPTTERHIMMKKLSSFYSEDIMIISVDDSDLLINV